MECVTVEILVKKILVSCIYRAPGSCVDAFNSKIVEMFDMSKETFVCGDFNTDLLNVHKLQKDRDFIDTMFSLGLFPTILKPSRITARGSTLIDNIFTNAADSRIEVSSS